MDPRIPVVLTLVAVLLQITGFVIYNRNFFIGRTKPNTTGFGLIVMTTFLNSSSYWGTAKHWLPVLPPISVFLCAVTTFTLALVRGHRTPIDRRDKVVIAAAVTIAALWVMHRNAAIANAMMQVLIGAGLVPIARGIRRWPGVERPLPWLIWTGVHTINLSVVILLARPWASLLYPINAIVLNGVLATMSHRYRAST